MAGLVANIINLITDNLRDRYHNGFPIIKELVQNADDAGATRFIFGIHTGFPDCKHPLLKTKGLWCFNNGQFKASDKRHIRSFAENAKAGESHTIGKFGLGMKSVFHLCEAFFYLACDGIAVHAEFLNPWDDGDAEAEHPHMDWDEYAKDYWRKQGGNDVAYVQQYFADYLDAEQQWFLLWIPLRSKAHLQRDDGAEYGSIINSFPGDDTRELRFLKEAELAEKLSILLPLLKNLQEIRFAGANEADWGSHAFSAALQTHQRMNLPEGAEYIDSVGKVTVKQQRESQELAFWGRRQCNRDSHSVFQQLKQDSRWPKTRYRDSLGQLKTAPDKSSAEGAILISHKKGSSGRLTLQWAVFLPLEEESHIVTIPLSGSAYHYHIILHGQFLIDAGRRGIHASQALQQTFALHEEIVDVQALRSAWNRCLAQQICLPLLLPALDSYIKTYQLNDTEITHLSSALKKAVTQLITFVTVEYSWLRRLLPTGGQWCLQRNNDAPKMLPLPAPPKDAPSRPWEVLPCLTDLRNVFFVDNANVVLAKSHYQWDKASILAVLQKPTKHLCAEATQLDYLASFLELIKASIGDNAVQQTLLRFIREAMSQHEQERLKKNKTKIARVVAHIPAEKRWKFNVDINDDALKNLWSYDGEFLPIPTYLDSDDNPEQAKLTQQIAELWLKSLVAFDTDNALKLKRAILEGLTFNERLSLIKNHDHWKLISAYDARIGKDALVSYKELSEVKEQGLLFTFAGLNKHEKIDLLVSCIEARVLAIRSEDEKLLFNNAQLPKEDDNAAILTSLLKSNAILRNNLEARKQLLKECHAVAQDKVDSNVIKGLRYLLHANPEQKDNERDILWVKAHEQSPAWEKLQRKLVGKNHWQVVDSSLIEVLPRNTWNSLAIKEIKPDEIIAELEKCQSIDDLQAEDFSSDERNEILTQIKDNILWRRLRWHKTVDERWVVIDDKAYLKTSIELPDELQKDINIIEPINDIKQRQSKWITKLDEAAAICIALNSAKPSAYVEKILCWLEKVDSKSASELEKKLQSTKWLLLKNGQEISPDDIIAIEGLEDAIQKLAIFANYVYASDKDLADTVIQFGKIIKPLFASDPKDTLEKLALLMNEAPHYAIGSLGEDDDISKLAKTLADCEAAP